MERKTAHHLLKTSFLKNAYGLTLMETLIVIALLAILVIGLLALGNYKTQIQKGRDAKRKSDLVVLKLKMEDYYNDHNRYPTVDEMDECKVPFRPYMDLIPCDPRGPAYYYETNESGQWYRIYTALEYEEDPAIASVGCTNGCGPDGTYNYGVSSNIALEAVPCANPQPPTCGNPAVYCGQQTPACCPGAYYIMTCVDGEYYCCPI